MPVFQDFFRHDINLVGLATTAVKYTKPCLLVDHADVPVDVRFRQVTPATYETRLTDATDQFTWFDTFYNQTYPLNPANKKKNVVGYVGRWVSAATKAYRVFPNASSVYTVYVALTNTAGFKIADGTNTEDITPDFTGDTDMDDAVASINVAFAASTNFTGYLASIDSMNRMIISGSATGASAPSFTLSAPTSGTDLNDTLGNTTSFLQAGLDAETLGAAVAAIRTLTTDPTVFFERGATEAQALAFLIAVDAIDGCFPVAVTADTDHEDSEATTTLAYQANALDLQAHVIYSRQTDYPDAVFYGEILPRDEGTCSYALTPCTKSATYRAQASGMALDGVTPAEVSNAAVEALDAVNCDFVTTPTANADIPASGKHTHLARGLCVNGDEVRIVLGQYYVEYNSSLEGYQYLVAQDVVTFSDPDIMAMKGIAEKWLDLSVSRRMINAGYQLDMPSAADFTAAEKESHYMSMPGIASAGIQYAVNQVFMSSTWSAQ